MWGQALGMGWGQNPGVEGRGLKVGQNWVGQQYLMYGVIFGM